MLLASPPLHLKYIKMLLVNRTLHPKQNKDLAECPGSLS